MDCPKNLLFLLCFLGCFPVSFSLGCLCERYDWSTWSPCTKTCNFGTQKRNREFNNVDISFWINSCRELCYKTETRACNKQACPINCKLTDYGPWSDCSSCAKKKFMTRSLDVPAQFGGEDCSQEVYRERDCHPSAKCRMEPINCKDKFKCANGRCIDPILKCNTQNDCGDRSDEKDCENNVKPVCNNPNLRPAPGSSLTGNGFNFLSGESSAAVLDTMFMGSDCRVNKTVGTGSRVYFRIPANIQHFDLKVEIQGDFIKEPQPVQSQVINMPDYIKPLSTSTVDTKDGNFMMFPILFAASSSSHSSHTKGYEEAIKSSKKKDSQLIRIHKVLPISRFQLKESDLYLSQTFLEYLHSLPIDYSFALYRDIFQRFGTHYYASGTLGGHYDLLYQYSREEIKMSGQSTETFAGCLNSESYLNVLIFYSEKKSVKTCNDNYVKENYAGSYIQASEKSYSVVRGGGTAEASALAWERKGTSVTSDTFQNWIGSLIDNPAMVDYEILPIISLVKDIPCAVTKRRHLRRALQEYLTDFDSCKCAPCPNNARAVLSGTQCKCVCQTGTYGTNCEIRAADYKSEAVDGSWSCWGAWSYCSPYTKRHRNRQCNNPVPLGTGKPCKGDAKQEEGCFVSIFPGKDVCINDDDFNEEDREEGLPPGVEGCIRPKRPGNSFLRIDKRYYLYGEEEEFLCYSGYELEGYQLITCRPGGQWTQPKGECLRKICDVPEVPEGITLSPARKEYTEGHVVGFNCQGSGLTPSASEIYKCTKNRPVFTWTPPIPSEIVCRDEKIFVPDKDCKAGEKMEGSKCVCVARESCFRFISEFCILNTLANIAVMMSQCGFTAGVCHNDPLFFVNLGPCPDEAGLDWARFRAKMSALSSVKEACGVNTCYEWESCDSESELNPNNCVCKDVRDCDGNETHMFCVKLLRFNRKRSMNLCSVAASKCARAEIEILNEGPCV